ncbi:uncharacterized protein LOC119171850 [Rhipicephalus microplus]|uniref:uncharacterized protein LOC119171850 n=1 Tax=Rhipicephalus microplus TaxID=6941 RepID=UPI003F6D074A
MSSSPCSCCTERPPGVSGPRRGSKRPDDPGWRRMVRRREHSEPVTRLQGGSSALVRRCRDFYAQRLRQSELLRNKWASGATLVVPSQPDRGTAGSAEDDDATASSDSEASSTWRRSRFDLAMDSLRKEISCLMERDNALFGQLLGLHQSIAELRREASQPAETTSSSQKPPSRPASLESLASSSSSSEPGCRRCSVAGGQLRRRRALSQTYDSGVQLHYGSSHSESDHEVFV